MAQALQLPSRGLREEVIAHLDHLQNSTSGQQLLHRLLISLSSLSACMAPRGTAHTPGSCPISWLCVWLPSTPAMKSSSTGQCSCAGVGLGGEHRAALSWECVAEEERLSPPLCKWPWVWTQPRVRAENGALGPSMRSRKGTGTWPLATGILG